MGNPLDILDRMSEEPLAAPLPAHGDVWYVSYGSNMSSARLSVYLDGGVPVGGTHHNPGARDSTAPRRDAAVDLPGALYFAGDSQQWGGGVAFYDHDAPGGPTAARAYLVTAGQFADIAAQEMRRIPEEGGPLEEIVIGGIDGGIHHAGPGHYETLVEVGRLDGAPMLLFTAPHGIDHVEHTRPAPAYVATLAAGLAESRQWDQQQVEAYLSRFTRWPLGD